MSIFVARRSFLAGVAAIMATTALHAEPRRMTVAEAHAAAGKGDILLLDIRTREEWRQTGIGETALPVSMHESDFLQRLNQLTGGDKSRPVALICAVGGRSQALQKLLSQGGYSHIIDVPEGMIGGIHGKGWLKSGLPLKQYR